MNNKMIAIIAVVILAVAGVSAILYYTLGNDKPSYDDRGRLMILGNANNDDYINEDDIDYLRAIIDGEVEKSPLADANNDGKIDEGDIEFVRRMISLNEKIASGASYQKMMVYYLNPHGDAINIASVNYPLERVAVVGSNVAVTVKLIGATDKVKCRAGGTWDETLFSDMIRLPTISDSIFQAQYELTMQHVVNRGSLDAILTLDSASYVPNYQDFENSGIKVVRSSSSDGVESISGALTMGYLLGAFEGSHKYVQFCDEVLNYVQSKVGSKRASDRVTSLSVTMSNYMGGLPSDYYAATQLAGSKNLADWNTTTQRFNIGDEWLLNKKYDADFIIHMRGIGYGNVDADDIWNTYSIYFKTMGAYVDGNYYIVNGSMPVALRVLYMAHVFYPGLVTEGYIAEKHQYCIDNFMKNLSEQNYRVSDGTFIISIGMVSEQYR